ncbi:DUF4190 domain-containing protein [Bacillus daqingensis]|uniref:DUF4190 domain-containing protein n=1 Tax=Bacillus daqingensis TaxID=872396 RepID=A0ABV9NQQ6_9BACI
MTGAAYNVKAIIGFIVSLLAVFVPVFGIVLAIIGIVLCKMAPKEIVLSGEEGSALAKAGFILGIIAIVLQLFFLIVGVAAFLAV